MPAGKKGSKALLFQMEGEDQQIIQKVMEEYRRKMLTDTNMSDAIRMTIRFWAKWHEEIERIEAERTLSRRKDAKS